MALVISFVARVLHRVHLAHLYDGYKITSAPTGYSDFSHARERYAAHKTCIVGVARVVLVIVELH
jgi:hypothetical protein